MMCSILTVKMYRYPTGSGKILHTGILHSMYTVHSLNIRDVDKDMYLYMYTGQYKYINDIA